MTTTILVASGPVTVENSNPYKTSSVTGAAPQWGDENDGTYGTAWTSGRDGDPNDGVIDNLRADIDPLTIDPATVTAISLHVRASTTNSQGTVRRVGFTLFDSRGDFFVVQFGESFATPAWNLDPDDSIHDYVSDLTPEVLTYSSASLADVAASLAAGAILRASRFNNNVALGTTEPVPYDHSLTVYKLWVEVESPGGTVTFTPAPPARLSGRMDGAFHGARRMDTSGPSRRGGFRPGGYY